MSLTLTADERATLTALLHTLQAAPDARYVGRGPVDLCRLWIGRGGGIACLTFATLLGRLDVVSVPVWARLMTAGLAWAQWWTHDLWAPADVP